MVNFNKNWTYFQTTKINFVAQIWTCFNLFLNSFQQTKLWSSQLNSISRTDDDIALDINIYQEWLLSLSWQKFFPLIPQVFLALGLVKNVFTSNPTKKEYPPFNFGINCNQVCWTNYLTLWKHFSSTLNFCQRFLFNVQVLC